MLQHKPPKSLPCPLGRILFLGAIDKAAGADMSQVGKLAHRWQSFWGQTEVLERLQMGNNALCFVKIIHLGILSKCLNFTGIQW